MLALPLKRLLICFTTLVAMGCSSDDDPITNTDGGGGEPKFSASMLFDDTQIHDIQITVSDSDWQMIQGDPLAEEYIPATMALGDEFEESAAFRYKGGFDTLVSCVSSGCPKLSFKVKFNHYDKSNRFAGVRRFNLHSAVRDPTMAREIMAYELYRKLGVSSPRATHAKVSVNGEYQGLFVLVEAIDKEFVEDHFEPGDGNLYKETWPRFPNPGEYVRALRTNEEAMDGSRMFDFYQTVTTTSDATFAQDVSPFIDIDDIGHYLAVDRAISNYDGISIFYCDQGTDICFNHNNYWYQKDDGKLALLPWDMDRTFFSVNTELGIEFDDPNENGCQTYAQCDVFPGDGCEFGSDILPSQCDPLFGHLHRATWNTSYKEGLTELADGAFTDIVNMRTRLESKIAGEIAGDPNHPGTSAFELEHENLEDILNGQLPAIQQRLSQL